MTSTVRTLEPLGDGDGNEIPAGSECELVGQDPTCAYGFSRLRTGDGRIISGVRFNAFQEIM